MIRQPHADLTWIEGLFGHQFDLAMALYDTLSILLADVYRAISGKCGLLWFTTKLNGSPSYVFIAESEEAAVIIAQKLGERLKVEFLDLPKGYYGLYAPLPEDLYPVRFRDKFPHEQIAIIICYLSPEQLEKYQHNHELADVPLEEWAPSNLLPKK